MRKLSWVFATLAIGFTSIASTPLFAQQPGGQTIGGALDIIDTVVAGETRFILQMAEDKDTIEACVTMHVITGTGTMEFGRPLAMEPGLTTTSCSYDMDRITVLCDGGGPDCTFRYRIDQIR